FLFLPLCSLATATTPIYTLSLHDALPISRARSARRVWACREVGAAGQSREPADRDRQPCGCSRDWSARSQPRALRSANDSRAERDRKSTRLNSSHVAISYAVFCLKKKKKK